MTDPFAILAGQLEHWPSKDELAGILQSAGLHVQVGRYAISVDACERFAFKQYGGDLGDPVIDAGAETVERLLRDAALVSDALASAGLKHRFEIYDGNDRLIGYVHHR